MNIVILDGFTLNPGDLSWSRLENAGLCTVYERTPEEEILPRARNAEILLTNKTPLSRETIAQLPHLRYIGVLATGYNIVDVAAARERGIVVTNVPSYGTMSVVQLVFAHLFNLTHRIGHHTEAVRSGRWSQSRDFSFRDYPLVEVSGLRLGIVGTGRIGSATARAALAFGMDVVCSESPSGREPPEGVRRLPLAEIFTSADVVSLHCPLTPATRELVNRDRLALMKRSSFLINTSRGQIIDEEALADALNGGNIAGAGLDVLALEPPREDNPLLRAKNCFITPHFAWATAAARGRLMTEVTEN
ncbi:MAG TPA: D-2-hydroxyacid dehydrogenase, partial [Bacteroidota bacterium]|nr:D-2-hydroxyacid dehydrogenase [Bacteroidota bacterium]